MKELIEYLKKIQIGQFKTEEFITKRVNIMEGRVDNHPQLQTPFQAYEVYLSLPRSVSGYTYDYFLRDIEKLLHQKGHLYSEGIVLIITYLFLLFNVKQRFTREAWLKFQQNYFTSCKLHMEFPMKIVLSNDEPVLKMNDYEIGQMDVKGFISKIKEHTGSDYHVRFVKEFGNNVEEKYLSFRRIEKKVPVVNTVKLLLEKAIAIENHKAIFDIYFENLSFAWFEKFWKELDEQQNTSVALGSVYYDLTFFRDFNFAKGTQTCVFTHIAGDPKQGWVMPIERRITSVHFDSKSPIDILNQKIDSYYQALSRGNSPFIRLINVLATFLSNGNRLLFQNKTNEAFLNFWIGLDSILNPTEMANSKELIKRVTAITYPDKSISYKVHLERIRHLYRYRGSLVHAGKEIERADALELANLLEEILMHLLEMHKKAVHDKSYDLDLWYKDVDELAHLLSNNARPEKLAPVKNALICHKFYYKGLQRYWQYQALRTKKKTGQRIYLLFRNIKQCGLKKELPFKVEKRCWRKCQSLFLQVVQQTFLVFMLIGL